MTETPQARVIVTGHSVDGESVVAHWWPIGWELDIATGGGVSRMWGFDELPRLPDAGSRPELGTGSPRIGGFRFVQLFLPPDVRAPEGTSRPGIFVRPDDVPGMHVTRSLDLVVVLQGEVVCELDGGETVQLGAGDSLIQNGTQHAWRNRGTEPAVLGVVAIGVEHDALPSQET